jgi:hypothetical protein
MCSDVFGVSNNPKPVAPVGRSNGASWNNKCFNRIPRAFQISEYFVEYAPAVHADEASNVFANNPGRPNLSDNSKHLRPEVAVVCLAFSLSGCTEGLAGEAAGNNVNCSGVGPPVKLADVAVDVGMGKVLF